MKQVRIFILGLVLMLAFQPVAIAADAEVLTEAVQESTMLLQLKQKKAQAEYRFYLLQNNVQKATEGLEEIRIVIKNLEATIAGLDDQIADTTKKITSVKSQMERKKMELKALEQEVLTLELQLEDQKALVSELMTLLYVKRGVYFDGSEINTVKVLASPNSVSETLQSLTYLDMIEDANQSEVDKMTAMSGDLSVKWLEIRQKKQDLDTLDEKLSADLLRLNEEKAAQEAVLDETRVEASIFEAMLSSADENEDELLREIEIYSRNVEQMEAKYAGTHILLSVDEKELITKIEQDMSVKFNSDVAADYLDLDWPVSPQPGLTALFNDESYVRAFGRQHYAIDIRVNHGNMIFAPADGVVSEIVFDSSSTRYGYVILQHRKGVSTLYGHVSEVAVSVGDYVQRGQTIGLSGGTPGTIGAGVQTTGPHLHFEVRQDGLRADPLLYLPLDELPAGELPEGYLDVMQAQLEDELKDIQEAMLTE